MIDAGIIGVLLALGLNVMLAIATVRITRHILAKVDDVAESLAVIRRELEARPKQPPRV